MQIKDVIAPLRHAVAKEHRAEEALHPDIHGSGGKRALQTDILTLVLDPAVLQRATQIERHLEGAEVVVRHPIDVAQAAKQAVATAQLVALETGETEQLAQILDM